MRPPRFGRRGPRRAGVTAGGTDGATRAGALATPDGAALWYRIDGPDDPEAPTVVVPCAGNAADFAGLRASDRRVVSYDVRNRGRSSAVTDLRRAGFATQVDDLAVVLDQLGIERCSIVGWSYHAGAAAAVALRSPERVAALVLASAIAPRSGTSVQPGREPSPAALANLDQLRAAGLERSDPPAWCRAWREVYVPLLMGDPSGFERMVCPCELPNEQPDHVARTMVLVFAGLTAYDWRDELANLAAPLLVLHGDEDREPLDSAYEWAGAAPDGQVLVLDGVGQFPWVERPDTFFGAVDRFLRAAGR